MPEKQKTHNPGNRNAGKQVHLLPETQKIHNSGNRNAGEQVHLLSKTQQTTKFGNVDGLKLTKESIDSN